MKTKCKIKRVARVQACRGEELELRTPVGAAQLRRLKRGFVSAATAGGAGRLAGGVAAERAFAAYLREQLDAALR
jgi:hypothetical protein